MTKLAVLDKYVIFGLNNSDFNSIEFDGIKNQAEVNVENHFANVSKMVLIKQIENVCTEWIV